MTAYYNEIEPAAAHVLRALIDAGHIARGDVDERSIQDVRPEDLRGYTQCHFFAGAGLWSVALRLAGWDDDRPIFTGSCPCQPFSVAGKGAGKDDKRHLWPDFFRLIEACRPAVVMGEQVSGAAGYDWFDGVAADLERANYAARALDIPACAVDAPHIRQRLYWGAVANSSIERRQQNAGSAPSDEKAYGRTGRDECEQNRNNIVAGHGEGYNDLADASRVTKREQDNKICSEPRQDARACSGGCGGGYPQGSGGGAVEDAERSRRPGPGEMGSPLHSETCSGGEANKPFNAGAGFWTNSEWRLGADGKVRRVKPGVRLLAYGVAGRAHALRLAGNSIVPQAAAEVISALMETL